MDRNLQILGLARKAGLLAVGAQDTKIAINAGKAQLILSARDTSAGALRRARRMAQTGQVIHLEVPYTAFELGQVSGRGSPGTLSFLDTGLAARFVGGLSAADPELYQDAAESLSQKSLAQAEKKKTTVSVKRRTVL